MKNAIIVPDLYATGRTAIGFDEVSCGYAGIELFRLDDLQEAQLGYSVDPDGNSLISDEEGGWRSTWLVIAYETGLGDPIFVSTEPPFAAFTAMHGEGSWDPTLIAPSLDAFWQCLRLYRSVANGREHPVALEANPLADQEIQAYLRDIRRLCDEDSKAVEFWALMVAEINLEDERS